MLDTCALLNQRLRRDFLPLHFCGDFRRNGRVMPRRVNEADNWTARNVNGKVILYADKQTGSMERMIDETNRRRRKQITYNKVHGITPVTIYKSIEEVLAATAIADVAAQRALRKEGARAATTVSDSVVKYLSEEQRKDLLVELKEEMRRAAKDLEVERAAELRDEIARLEKKGEKS